MLKFVSENRMVIASASYTCILSDAPEILPVMLQYAGFLFNRKLRSLLNKTLREMRTTLYACSLSSRKRSLSEPMCRAKWKFVAKATALGARVPQAELYVPFGLSLSRVLSASAYIGAEKAEGQMKIYKVLNNNVAIIRDTDGREKVVMGKGICFHKRSGEEIDEAAVDKVFAMSSEEADTRFRQMVQDMPLEHMQMGERIISEAKLRLGKRLNDMIYISLIDHVYTSVCRFLDGITVKNVLLWDIRRFYREEYEIGLWALEQIKEQFKVELPEDEAGFIALHIANAEMDEESMHNMYEITKVIQEIENIVKYFFHIEFDTDDVYYYRFITHLKFFAKRLSEGRIYQDGSSDGLLDIIKAKYADAFRCVEKITQFIKGKYKHELSGEEQLYLTIHIARVVEKIER